MRLAWLPTRTRYSPPWLLRFFSGLAPRVRHSDVTTAITIEPRAVLDGTIGPSSSSVDRGMVGEPGISRVGRADGEATSQAITVPEAQTA